MYVDTRGLAAYSATTRVKWLDHARLGLVVPYHLDEAASLVIGGMLRDRS
jgi:hypothetical protein